uniref:NADH dehydrogenase subunit 6 n=1 Tax=Cryptotympana atrata TaxID=678702 RepID=UPI001BF0A07D|nr:NADH dehydrogenase subunit 6 [Cryptotympana atrata]QUV77450.1 NADH dehydrogenase subunit 6 [Cryptotympana atrata]
MKIILLSMTMFSINFLFMKHPLSMGFILLLQTILSSVVLSYNMCSYIYSYILILIFIGGMLILFMYMASIASNEKFFFSMKLILMSMLMTLIVYSYMLMIDLEYMNLNKMIYLIDDQEEFFMNKMFSFPSGIMILVMVIYLLFTLIVIVNIIKIKIAPLRSN